MKVTYRIGLVDVGLYHFSENGLAADVPDLEGNLDVTWQLHTLHKEVHAYSLLVGLSKVVIAEPHNEGSFADGTVPEDNDLILKIFGSIVLIIIVVLICRFHFLYY